MSIERLRELSYEKNWTGMVDLLDKGNLDPECWDYARKQLKEVLPEGLDFLVRPPRVTKTDEEQEGDTKPRSELSVTVAKYLTSSSKDEVRPIHGERFPQFVAKLKEFVGEDAEYVVSLNKNICCIEAKKEDGTFLRLATTSYQESFRQSVQINDKLLTVFHNKDIRDLNQSSKISKEEFDGLHTMYIEVFGRGDYELVYDNERIELKKD